jgi:hypothetical protein
LTTFHYFLASELWSALAARQDAPDEVFLVDTTADAVWAVVPLKRGARILSGRVPIEVVPDSLMDITANLSG